MIIVKLTAKEVDMAVAFIEKVNLAEYFKQKPESLARFKKLTKYDDPEKFFSDLVEQMQIQNNNDIHNNGIALTDHQWILTFTCLMYVKKVLEEHDGELKQHIRDKILPTIKSICTHLADGLDTKDTLH